MADQDAVVRLMIDTLAARDQVRSLKEATAALRGEILEAVLAQKSMDAALADPAIRRAAADLARMEGELKQANEALKHLSRTDEEVAAAATRAARAEEEQARAAHALAEEARQAGAEAARQAEIIGVAADRSGRAAERSQQQAMAAARATAESYNALERDTTKATRGSAYALMQLGNTLDDLQYVPAQGLRPIINNVMQIAPQVGIAMIAVDALRKALEHLPDLFKDSGLSEFAGDVEKLKAKVDELNGSWLQTQSVVREAKRAMGDLRDAEEAAKVKEEAGATTTAPAGAFAAGIKATSGGRAAAIVNQMIQDQVGRAPAAAVREAIQSGVISQAFASSQGLNVASSQADVAAAMAQNPAFAAMARQAVVGQRTNAMLAQLRGGDQNAFDALYNYIEGNARLGRRGGDDKFKDPFARAMEESYLKHDPTFAGAKEAEESGRKLAKQMTAAESKAAREEEKADREAEKMDAEHRRLLAERDRKGEQEWEKAGRDQEKHDREEKQKDREAERDMDRQVTERNRIAREALRAPGVRGEIERMFAQGGDIGDIAPRVGRFLEQQGLAPKGEGMFVGYGAAGQVQQDLQGRVANYTARGMDQTQAFAAVQGEILQEFARMDQRLWHMEQGVAQQQGVMQGVQQTRLNRNGGW